MQAAEWIQTIATGRNRPVGAAALEAYIPPTGRTHPRSGGRKVAPFRDPTAADTPDTCGSRQRMSNSKAKSLARTTRYTRIPHCGIFKFVKTSEILP